MLGHGAGINTKLTIRAAKDLSRVPTKADIVGRSHSDANELPRWIKSLFRHAIESFFAEIA
jgi:hypothetical protein